MHSLSFDRAAETYEETRGFPPGVAGLVAETAHDLVRPAVRVAEIGVGTGRIARPLLARGLQVTGIDLSRAMMLRLRAALPPGTPLPALAQGDAAHLPFAAGACEAVLSVHVFHLIANWRAALDEVRRVLPTGGKLLIGYEWRPADSPGAQLMTRWTEIVRAAGWQAGYPPPHEFDDLKAYLLASGAAVTERSVGEWTVSRTLARQLESIEHRTWSTTWDVPESFFAACLAELRVWAAARYGGLDTAFEVPHRFVWQCFAWPVGPGASGQLVEGRAC
jgi:SAM-dependent methyltransferase